MNTVTGTPSRFSSRSIKKALAILLAVLTIVSLTLSAPRNSSADEPAVPAVLTLYEGPATMRSSSVADVRVDGYPLFVYDVMVNHQHIWSADAQPSRTPMTYFDFSGTVSIEIRMPGLDTVESAEVLPSSAGIIPSVKEGVVCFTLSEPGAYTVVFNHSVNQALHLFANPPETDIPSPDDPNVFYVGPGEWVMDAVSLTDGQTLYLAGGAVLHSVVSVAGAKDVRIRGRGIIDGSDYPAWNQPGSSARVPINLDHAKQVEVEGIILVNSNCWNLNSYSSSDVAIHNVKIISGRQNGDGFTFQSCLRHTVTDCFARTWDDSLVIKNYSGSSADITFRNIQIWTDLAQSMEIGYETDKGLTLDPEISGITFEDITVLYNFHKPVISIHNSDDAFVHDITYRNIVVENAFMQGDNGINKELIEMTLQNSAWSTVRDEFGSIDSVVIDGLTVVNTPDGKIPASRFSGQSEEHRITNVTMKNIRILDQKISSLKDMKASVNEFCEGISVIAPDRETQEALPGEPARQDRDRVSLTAEKTVTVVSAPKQSSAERPACFPDPTEDYIPLPEGENLALNKPVASGAHTDVYVSANVNDGKTDTYWESKGFPAEMTLDLQGSFPVSAVAVCLNPSAVWEPRTQEIEVLISSDGENFEVVVPAAKYDFRADTGNRIRMDFPAVEAAFVRLVFTLNTSSHTGGAQAAEIGVWSEP